MITSSKLTNATYLVGEIDIDTKRPQIDSNFQDMPVKQIKVKDSRIPISQHNCNKQANWRTPTTSSINAMKIKQRVLTPFQQKIDFNRLDLSRIAAASDEMRLIPEIVVTEFLDENNNNAVEYEINRDTSENQEESCSENYNTHSGILEMEYSKYRLKECKQSNSGVNIEARACGDSAKCDCCNKTILKIDEKRVFVSNSVKANLAIDEFDVSQQERFDKDSLSYLEPINKVNGKCLQNETGSDVDSYDNDYYLMNELLSQKKPESLKETCVQTKNEYFYYYCSSQKYKEISGKRLIKQEPMIIEGQLKNALVLLTLTPDSEDLYILNELYEKNTPIDLGRIESYIKIKREIIEQHAEYLVKVNENKYLFKRSIILQGKFPTSCRRKNQKPERQQREL